MMKSRWTGRRQARNTKPTRGSLAEQQALDHLEAAGLTLLQRNFRCRLGEIDLVMQDGDCIVFVEVRFRSAAGFGGAAETVDRRKQQRLASSAAIFLGRQAAGDDHPVRFDVVAIDSAEDGAVRLQWLRDAFRV